ncbi:MAG: dihydrolipoamide acetyltransferase family protein [Arachnia sp.]
MPDPGEGLLEAEIVAWRVAVGDVVKINDVLVEIETAKSLVELPSPFAGTVTELLVAEGTTVEVGTDIVVVDDGVESARAAQPPAEPAAAAPNLVGYGSAEEGSRRRRARPKREDTSDLVDAMSAAYEPHEPGHRPDEVHPAGAVHAEPSGDPLPEPGAAPAESQLVLAHDRFDVRAKPPVRNYAKELGVDLAGVTGTGPEGTVTYRDVEAAAAFDRAEAQPQQGRILNDSASFQAAGSQAQYGYGPTGTGFGGGFGPSGRFGETDADQGRHTRRVPIKGVRKATADNMTQSVQTHVHVTEWVTIDVTGTMEFLETLKGRREFAGLRISPLLVYAKALCLALDRNPEMNSSWDEQAQEIVYHGDVNLGIAAATPRGLMVPNIKGAHAMSLLQLGRAIGDLVAVSRDGKLQPADYSGGTFTITNVGVFGIDAGTPILNGNETGIFCMGSIKRRPWVVGQGAQESVVPRWVTTISVTFDHRIVDGEQGSRFLHDVASILAEPALALLF